MHRVCQLSRERFEEWEAGRGPCLPVVGDDVGPGLWQRALHFGAALARHAADGGRRVEPPLREARLTACSACPACDTERLVCRDVGCGCFLELKSWWASETCPRGQWPPPD